MARVHGRTAVHEGENTPTTRLRHVRGVTGQVAVLALMVAGVLWPALAHRNMLPGGYSMSDIMISHWPSALLLKRTVAQSRRLPLWNPFYGGGRPVAADPLAALFYPPTHLVHGLEIRDHILALQAGHVLLAGAGTLVLARVALKLSPWGALVAALGFAATPRLVAHLGAGHLTMIQTVAWLPWVATACWSTVHNPARWSVPLGGSVALMVLAGHPQLAYYGALMVLGLSAWLLATRGRPTRVPAVIGLGCAAVLAAALASVHLLPLVEFMAHSTRQHAVRSSDALALSDFLRALVGIRMQSPVIHEALFDPGLAVLCLAVLGVGLVAGLALGVSSPVYRIAALVLPGFDKFRGLGRIWFVGLLGVALLAGLGVDPLLDHARRIVKSGVVIVGAACVLLVGLNLLWADRGLARIEPVAHLVSDLDRAVARAARGGAGAPDDPVERRRRRSPSARLPDVDAPGDERARRADLPSTADAGRSYGVERNLSQLSAVQLDVQLADGWDPLLIEPYVTFMQRAGGYTFTGYQLSVPPYEVYDPGYPTSQQAQPNAALLGLVNVRVVLSRTRLADPRLVEVDNVDGTIVYRNLAQAGHTYLVGAEPSGSPPALDQARRLAATFTVRERTAERLTVDVTSSTGGYVVFGAPAFPGWEAWVDTRPTPLTTIEGVLLAVRVGPGAHRITYAYAPRTVYTGAVLALPGLVAGLGWMARSLIMPPRFGSRSPARRSVPVRA